MSLTLLISVTAVVAAGLWLGRQARLVAERVAEETSRAEKHDRVVATRTLKRCRVRSMAAGDRNR